MYPTLGSNGFAQQAESMAASFAAKTATTAGVTALTSGAAAGSFGAMIGSAAGPIGMVVGLLVSFLISLFGPKMKDPVFGIVAVIPETDNGKITVGRMLDLLNKQLIDMGWGWGIHDKTAHESIGKTIKAVLDSPPQGALGIASGGLPTSHPQVAKIDFSRLQSYTSGIAKPFIDILSLLTEQAKANILSSPLPYQASKSYYFQIGETPGKAASVTNRWAVASISQVYDAVKISGGKALGKSMEKAWKQIPQDINSIFIKFAGVDIMSGAVIDQAKADIAFKPKPSITSILPASNLLPWLLIGGGVLLLTSRQIVRT